MSLFIYKWDTHDETGITGWISKLHPNFDPSGPELIVHDCLEHFPRGYKHGPAADELLALGARMYLRVESGWWWNQKYFGSPSDTWSDEIIRIAEDINYCLDRIPSIKAQVWEMDTDAELIDCIDEFIHKANNRDRWEDEEVQKIEPNDPALKHILNWLRRGALAAKARYKDKRPEDVMWLGECMIKELERYRHGEYGDTLHVRVHEKDMEFKITHISLYN